MAAVHSEFPGAKDMININLGSDYLPDPFNKSINQASRVIARNQESLKKVEHTYTESVKKQINLTKAKGAAAITRKSMATEFGKFGRKTGMTGRGFLFEEDAHMVASHNARMPAYSTAQKELGNTYQSSEHGVKGDGKVYKFKNIHGDRGTLDGLSSQAQNNVPSSIWRDHPIPTHLQEIPGGHLR